MATLNLFASLKLLAPCHVAGIPENIAGIPGLPSNCCCKVSAVVGDSAIAVAPALVGVPKIKHFRLLKYPAMTIELVFLLLDHPTFYYQTKEANCQTIVIRTSTNLSVPRV